MRVLFVSPEVYPFAKTGGLGDVAAALPAALAGAGTDVCIVMPGYPHALDQVVEKSPRLALGSVLGHGDVRLVLGRLPIPDVPVWLIDCPALYQRGGGLYQDEGGEDWPDNADRFAMLAHVAARIAMGVAEIGWRPDVVHANDWQTGLIAPILRAAPAPRPATVMTIHNLAFQGLFPLDSLPRLGLPTDYESVAGLEYYGKLSFLKGGIRFSDRLTTVSPAYAREILSPEFGCGFHGLLRERVTDLTGILNGADYGVWDPSTDPEISHPYSRHDMAGKRICKTKLQQELGLEPSPETPLIAYVSRLTEQKMADLLPDAVPQIVATGAQVAILGQGAAGMEAACRRIEAAHPGAVAVRTVYQESLAHRMHAGADMVLAPSRFEPCGLTQIYAMRYGTLPIVRRVGGLLDTVCPVSEPTIRNGSATGFAFEEVSVAALVGSVNFACEIYHQPIAWRRIQMAAMERDFGWRQSAQDYLSLYQQIVPVRPIEQDSPEESGRGFASSMRSRVRHAATMRETVNAKPTAGQKAFPRRYSDSRVLPVGGGGPPIGA